MEYNEICLLNDSFPPLIDGVANAVVNYAKEIKNSGHGVSVVTPECPGADDSRWDYPVIRYPGIDFRKNLGYVAGNPFSLSTQLQLNRRPISLLHSHCPVMSNTLARTLRTAMDVPLVLTYHTKFDTDIQRAVKSRLLQAEAVHALVGSVSACDELWVVSRGAGENIRSLGYKGDYIVMPNGVDMPRGRVSDDLVASATQGYDLPADVPVFIFVGRLMWYKGIRIILDALAELKYQHYGFRMIFIGGGGDEAEIKAYCDELMLGDRVFFTGPVHDRNTLRAWYCRADLFLFPSVFDTNGLVVREAAACSLGSVLIDGSCAAEGVKDGVDGLLIRENAASLALCLAKLIGSKQAMRSIGENACNNIYLSWHDAVGLATERYGIVLDNYKSGKYAKRPRFSDELFKFTGDLVSVISDAEDKRRELAEKFEKYI